MAVGQIIGKVAVKVAPHTKDFRKEAQRDLERIEKSLDAEARVTFNLSQVKFEALKTVKNLNAVLKGNDSYKVQFRAKIATTGMNQAIRDAQAELERRAKTERIKFSADVASVLISGELDQESLKSVKKELEHWRDQNSPLSIAVKPDLIPGFGSYISARLAVLTRPRTAPIVPVLDEGAAARVGATLAALSGARVLNDVFDNLWSSIKRLDKSVPIFGSMALAVLGLGGYALSAASNLFALSQSLAQIGPAALALPGIFGGLLIGLGATIAVLKDFNTIMPKVGDAFSRLQNQMSANFWEVAAKPMRQLIWGLLPQLSAGLKKTSTELGGFFATFSTALQGQFDGALAGMFADLSESIAIASGHTDSFAMILRILGEVGAGYLPRLAGWFGDISDRFAGFLDKAQKDGSLVGWIDRGIFQLKELGRGLGNLGGIFSGLAEAASNAGGSNLTMLADSLGRIEEIVKGPVFQSQLTGVLMAAHAAMGAIADVSGPAVSNFFNQFATTLQAVLPIVGAAIGTLGAALFDALANPAVQSAFTSMMTSIASGAAALAPAFAAVVPAVASLMKVIGALASNLGPLLAAAFTAIGPGVAVAANALIPLINMLGPILTKIVTALGPVFDKIGATIAKVAVAAQPLIERISGLVDVIMPVLVPALNFLVTILGGAIIGAINGAIKVFDGIKQVVEGVMDVFSGFGKILSGDFSAGFSQVFSGLGQIVSGAFTAIVGVIMVWLNVTIIGIFRGAAVKLLTLWKGGWNAIKGALTSAWNAIKGAVTAGFNSVRNTISNILNVIKALWLLGWRQYSTVLRTVWSTIRGVVTGGINAVKGVITGALAAIKGGWSTGWNALKSTLSKVWEGIKTVVTGGIGKVISVIGQIPTKAKTALAGLTGALSEVFTAALEAIKAKVTAAIDWIVAKFKALKDKIPKIDIPFVGGKNASLKYVVPAWAAQLKGDKAAFFATGVALVRELERGVDANLDKVVENIQNVMARIPKGASQNLKNAMKSNKAAMAAQLEQWKNMADDLATRKEEYQQLLNEANNYALNIAQSVIGEGAITRAAVGSFASMKDHLKKALENARKFKTAILALVNMNLNQTSIDQMLAAGPEAALAYAEALAASGQSGVNEINALQGELSSVAADLGDIGKSVMFQEDLDIAKAMIDSIASGKSALVEQIRLLALEMMAEIEKALKPKGDKPNGGGGGGKPPKKPKGKGKGGRSIQQAVDAAMSNGGRGSGRSANGKTFIYNAAPNKSFSSEEDLFEAANRGRMVGW